MEGVKHFFHNQVKNAYEAVAPDPTKSQFESKRLLTPEEFVTAGDHLVATVGSWAWAEGDPSKRVKYLPRDKQFLVTRNVPCRKRASALSVGESEVNMGDDLDKDAWVCAEGSAAAGAASGSGAATATAAFAKAAEATVGDLEDNADDDDTYQPAATTHERRSYDLYITYSKYYQVPQFWLVGFSENKIQLQPKQMQQDISADHMAKTVTIDPFPHTAKLMAMSIHPCKHASTMKVFGDQQIVNGKAFPVHHYLILFLKFISGVVPTIEYDYSMEWNMQ